MKDGVCSPSHTRGKPPPPGREARVGTLKPSEAPVSTSLHRNRSWNLLNQNGQAGVPGGGAGPQHQTKNQKLGEWLSDRYGSGESKKGKGLSTVWRLDWAQGLGHVGGRTPLGVWSGASAPPGWPPTHPPTHPPEFGKTSSAAQASGSPGGRSLPSVWPSSGFPQHPQVPPT